MNPKEYSASEAKRMLEELAPYFAELEKQSIEEMVKITTWDEESDRKRRYCADHVRVIRDLQSKLQSEIMKGAERRAVGIV